MTLESLNWSKSTILAASPNLAAFRSAAPFGFGEEVEEEEEEVEEEKEVL